MYRRRPGQIPCIYIASDLISKTVYTMRYRQLLTFLVVITFGIGLVGCEDFLNINPEQSVESQDAFASQSIAESALNGLYDGLQQDGAYGGFFVAMADFTALNGNFGGSFSTWQRARDFTKNATHGPSENMWADFYESINRANDIIANVPEIDDAEDEFVTRAVNEAKFVRALEYFNLVRLYAQPYTQVDESRADGVPVITSPTDAPGPELEVPRDPVAAVYDQIVSDLQDARNNLSPAESAGQLTASADAATALLAKVRLYQGQYAAARDLAEQVINSGTFELAGPETIAEQQGSSSESIFSVSFSQIDNTGVNAHPSSFYTPSALGGRGDITVTSDFISTLEGAPGGESDLRGPGGIIYEFEGSFWTQKWDSPNQADDAMVLRLSEMYLIAAEGHARTAGADGSEEAALNYVNAIRAKNGAESITAENLLEDIIRERRLELAFEGDRFHDLLRLGRTLESTTGEAPETQRIFPIPSRELDENSELTQNPGY